MRTDAEVKAHNIWPWISLEGLIHSPRVLCRATFVFLCNIYVKLRFEMSFPTMNLRGFVSLIEVLINSLALIFLYGYLVSVLTRVADCIIVLWSFAWYISQRDIWKQCKIMYTWNRLNFLCSWSFPSPYGLLFFKKWEIPVNSKMTFFQHAMDVNSN